MPHQCTNCDRTFPDGSKEMLSGCPDCGGNKFQFTPAGRGSSGDAAGSEPAGASTGTDAAPNPRDAGDGAADWPDSGKRPADRAPAEDTDRIGTDRPGSDGPSGGADRSTDPDSGSWPPAAGRSRDRSGEDDAQASARSEVVSSDELPSPEPSDGPDLPPDHGRVVDEPDDPDERPSIDELREELNDQFESIKIVQPGQYELNLMELYDREEHIVSLQEDGRYVIDVPDSWHENGDDS